MDYRHKRILVIFAGVIVFWLVSSRDSEETDVLKTNPVIQMPTVPDPFFPVVDWSNHTKPGASLSCKQEACWLPIQSKAHCEDRCVCEWFEEHGVCGCAIMDHVPACQAYFPRPNITALQRLMISNPGLRPTDRITVLGDSVTWLGGYPLLLEKAVRQQGVTTPIAVRACEGATVADLLYGNPKLSPDCKAVDVVLQETRPTIALILIGINDLKGTAKNKQFMTTLLSLVRRVQGSGATVVLSTLFALNERTLDHVQLEPGMVRANEIIARVAHLSGATLTDLRKDVCEYELAFNTVAPGGLIWGILTTDSANPCRTSQPPCTPDTHGNYMIAESFARGLIDALRKRRSQP